MRALGSRELLATCYEVGTNATRKVSWGKVSGRGASPGRITSATTLATTIARIAADSAEGRVRRYLKSWGSTRVSRVTRQQRPVVVLRTTTVVVGESLGLPNRRRIDRPATQLPDRPPSCPPRCGRSVEHHGGPRLPVCGQRFGQGSDLIQLSEVAHHKLWPQIARWIRTEFVHKRSSPNVSARPAIAWRSLGQFSQSSSASLFSTLMMEIDPARV